ncbi:MAG: Gfo/Idh/MocA family oxidoreductase [Alphaproteobacteria bacterium]|nr:Gfo/Idh/MocA family oxidoreductase [Alphaproteobacteria bacterium]
MSKGHLRVAVAGAGYFARFHHEAWSRLPGVDLTGICDHDAAKAAAAAAAVGSQSYSDLTAMLDDGQIDLLDIATPPDTHLALVSEAVRRGLPVICQKPLAPTTVEAREIVAITESAGVLLTVHENFRFQPWYREIRRLLDTGRLGDPHGITFRLRPGDGQGPAAYLDRQPYFQEMERFLIHETGIHFIDTFRFLMGEVTGVYADLRRVNPAIAGEDAGIVTFRFASGAAGLFDGNRLNDHAADNARLTMGEMWLEGSDGVLRLDGYGRLWWKPHRGDETAHAYAWHDRGFAGDCVAAIQAHVLNHLRHGAPLENDGRSYLRNMEIEEAVYRSAAEGRRIAV